MIIIFSSLMYHHHHHHHHNHHHVLDNKMTQVAAAHMNADSVVHFGHTCLTPSRFFIISILFLKKRHLSHPPSKFFLSFLYYLKKRHLSRAFKVNFFLVLLCSFVAFYKILLIQLPLANRVFPTCSY